MDFLRPASWQEALAAKAEHPAAVPIAGGTDVMVEINFDHRRPEYLLDLNRIGELQEWEVGADTRAPGRLRAVHRGSWSTLRAELPGLALASHTVASPQIRNRGGVGGNLGTASPAGDAHPALLAGGGEVEAESVRGTRLIPIDDFYLGVKRNALAARRADQRGAPEEGRRAAAVLQGRHPQRHGDRGLRVRHRAAPRHQARCAPASVRPRPPRSGPGRPRSSWPRRSTRAASGTAAGSYRRRWPSSSPTSWPAPPTRSTTCAAPPRTAGTRWASWPAAPSAGPGSSTAAPTSDRSMPCA